MVGHRPPGGKVRFKLADTDWLIVSAPIRERIERIGFLRLNVQGGFIFDTANTSD